MRILSPALLTTFLLLAGCGGGATSHESVAKEHNQLMNDFVGTLESITDKKTAEAARPKLEAIGKKMEELGKKVEALPKPTPEAEQKLAEQFKSQQAALIARINAWTMKMMAQPEVMAAIGDVMGKMKDPTSGR
jgi:ABC-type glycerol-3-phosphate transport system substrate-binding protein